MERQQRPTPQSLTPSRMRELRRYLRLTQGEMARYMEVDVSTVRRWEYGARRPAGGNRRRLLTLARKHLSGGDNDQTA